MLELKVIGSGSSGNAYILQYNDKALLIECGAGNVKDYIDLMSGRIVGGLISHKHGDHLSPSNLKKLYDVCGITMYSMPSLAETYSPMICAVEPKHKFDIGPFRIMPLNVPHGDVECFAYIIDTPDGRLVFATDLSNFPYNIKGCNYLCIECNYDISLLNEQIDNGVEVFSQSQNHMELNTCITCIERHIAPDLTHVVLLHLSKSLSDKKAFIERIRQRCEDKNYPFIKVYVADKDENIELFNIPF